MISKDDSNSHLSNRRNIIGRIFEHLIYLSGSNIKMNMKNLN